MKRIMFILLCVSLLAAGGITAYLYLDSQEDEDLSSEMFVDRGEINEYATMYDLLKGI